MTKNESETPGASRVERVLQAPETTFADEGGATALFTVDAELVEAAERTEAFLTDAVERVTAVGALAGRGVALLSGGAGRLLLGHAGAQEDDGATEDWRTRLRRAERRTGLALEQLSRTLGPDDESAGGPDAMAQRAPAMSRAIRRHPAVALGVAAVGGLAVGLLLRRLP